MPELNFLGGRVSVPRMTRRAALESLLEWSERARRAARTAAEPHEATTQPDDERDALREIRGSAVRIIAILDELEAV